MNEEGETFSLTPPPPHPIDSPLLNGSSSQPSPTSTRAIQSSHFLDENQEWIASLSSCIETSLTSSKITRKNKNEDSCSLLIPTFFPPRSSDIFGDSSLSLSYQEKEEEDENITFVDYSRPFFTNPSHLPLKPQVVHGRKLDIPCQHRSYVPKFDDDSWLSVWRDIKDYLPSKSFSSFLHHPIYCLSPTFSPPSSSQIEDWLEKNAIKQLSSRKRQRIKNEKNTKDQIDGKFRIDDNTGRLVPILKNSQDDLVKTQTQISTLSNNTSNSSQNDGLISVTPPKDEEEELKLEGDILNLPSILRGGRSLCSQPDCEISLLYLEVIPHTTGHKFPNPELDEICSIVWIHQLISMNSQSEDKIQTTKGVILQRKHVNLRQGGERRKLFSEKYHNDDELFDPSILQDKSLTREFFEKRSKWITSDKLAREEAKNLSLPPFIEKLIVCCELELVFELLCLVRRFDPDFLAGYDLHNSSWRYVMKRCDYLDSSIVKEDCNCKNPLVSGDFISMLGRCTFQTSNLSVFSHMTQNTNTPRKLDTHQKTAAHQKVYSKWGKQSTFGVKGRGILYGWRIMRNELKVQSFTFSRVIHHVFGIQFPEIPPPHMFSMLQSEDWHQQHSILTHLMNKIEWTIKLLENLDIIRITAEMSRLFGIDFCSVLSRGSQFRVEAMMLRLTKSLNYVCLSPTRRDVSQQAAMECIPMVLEPHSSIYTDPVAVFDFQSLYPSMMIAYNLCFSTCLGKLQAVKRKDGMFTNNTQKLGAMFYPQYQTSEMLILLQKMEDGLDENLFIAPNGSIFCTSKVRQGVLPQMLKEILETRVMIKKSMKKYKELKLGGPSLQRTLHARQYSLKVLACVVYGYTAAGFSGRMPMAELADSIVQCSRNTLRRAMIVGEQYHPSISPTNHLPSDFTFVSHKFNYQEGGDNHNSSGFNFKVVYGDTDSMFLLMKGVRLMDAFHYSKNISSIVTQMNPYPVVLKIEKVYLPCVLVSKKRYSGNFYEREEEIEKEGENYYLNRKHGKLDVKGLEAVRRDQCPLVVKIQDMVLKLIFKHSNLSLVREYLEDCWTKVLNGKYPMTEFVFSKAVRLGSYSTNPKATLPPAAVVATRWKMKDPMREPPSGSRISYLVVTGPPTSRLHDLILDPIEAVYSPERRVINYRYYIEKQVIPTLHRILVMVGVDLQSWWKDLPKPAQSSSRWLDIEKGAIGAYLYLHTCEICGEKSKGFVCEECKRNLNQENVKNILTQKREDENQLVKSFQKCSIQCSNLTYLVNQRIIENCHSVDCASLFVRNENLSTKNMNCKKFEDLL